MIKFKLHNADTEAAVELVDGNDFHDLLTQIFS